MSTQTDTSPHAGPTRVLCVDDCPDTTAAIRMVIDSEPSMQCVGCLASADDLIERVRRFDPPPHVVLLDASMPGRNAFEAMSELAAEFPKIKTIIFSGHDDPAFVERAMQAGACGCISKGDEPEAIVRAVRTAASGAVVRPRNHPSH